MSADTPSTPHRTLPPGLTDRSVTAEITAPIRRPPMPRAWLALLAVGGAGVALLAVSVFWLFYQGVGIWGINIPVNWGLAIVNTVWWIGIGHAGTFISAVLLVTGQPWRNSLNRFAEAMTLFAASCAALYPLLHLGRPFYFYWVFPYPNVMHLWPQFRSPLEWDMFAFSTYLTVSLVFWYVGMIPDMAALRDTTRGSGRRVFYGLLALGWRGSAVHWARWRRAYVLLAAIAVPLVVSVHSGVAMLFAGGPVAGWNNTIFPPYFVLGAVFSGFAVVILLAIVLRAAFGFGDLVTARHMDLLGQWLLATGLMTGYGYLMDAFSAWYGGDPFEVGTLLDRLSGDYRVSYWAAVLLNFLPLQLLWWPRARASMPLLATVAASVVVGMWFERFMLVTGTLSKSDLPSAWGEYTPSVWEWTLFAGLIGFFLFAFCLFVRFFPAIPIAEVKEVLREDRTAADRTADAGAADRGAPPA
ncbi:polysulfide reductase NrfD [Azospirillum doebereinerae]|uniref:NrfD/PsrC family molybdoenzyme membrane anchor subunit n=1 Tax=Azospirillum doebereinerae TaxID=92933 RepID=UPI001EE53FF9|nr:NrfD/PsrC family molybdoenzyme membrane anchor subunit [Azospirillum doebereinerae]MCG5239731.1 polysulfide reductase NrfD [Azospirillum doebereinerae]